MILGVDHIALSCGNIAEGVRLLGQIGYQAKFIHEGIPNPPAKKPLLREYDPLHSLAYCQKAGSVSLELTKHSAKFLHGPSPYQILFSGVHANTIPWLQELPSSWESAWRNALGCRRPVAAQWRSFYAQFWHDAHIHKESSGAIRALMVPVIDLAVAKRFWVQGLGCRYLAQGLTEQGMGWLLLAFAAPVPAWCLDLVLIENDGQRPKPRIDDTGFPCLALITNRLARDKEIALETGAREATEEFFLEVGNKVLKIIVIRGPDNELIEMIEFIRPQPGGQQ